MQDQNENQVDENNSMAAPVLSVQDAPGQDSSDEEPVPNIPGQPSVEALIDNSSEDIQEESDELEESGESAKTNSPMKEVSKRINDSQNILIALSADPSVDDLTAAIGLSLTLDKTGRRATAIYSGETPNILEFLNPEDTFETTTDTLQDFVIALDKEKADHLRYKLDGDYVKIYITPYRTRIAAEDLEFSYGSFNVDLVIGISITNGTDLDAALREHGRVMHDATVVNITTGAPGKFGEIEWSDPRSSSVSEMVAELLYSMGRKISVDKDEATALLTGIIAATDRFSNKNTSPETMQVAARLMASGADQRLITEKISSNIQDNTENLGSNDETKEEVIEEEPNEEKKDDAINIQHDDEPSTEPEPAEEPSTEPEPVVPEPTAEPTAEPTTPDASAELFSASKEPVSEFNMPDFTTLPPVNTPAPEPVVSEPELAEEPAPEPEPTPETQPVAPASDPTTTPAAPSIAKEPENVDAEVKSEKVVEPNAEFAAGLEEGSSKYGQMLEDALNEINGTEAPVVTTTVTPEMSAPALGESVAPEPIATPANPAASITPSIAPNPDINGVPEINYNMPMPGDELLPPPPAPPIENMGALPPMPEAPAETPTPSIPAPTDAAPAATTESAPTDPAAFKIP